MKKNSEKKFETSKRYPGVRRRVDSNLWSWRLRINGKDHAGYGYSTAKEAFEARERFRAEMMVKGVSTVTCNKTVRQVYDEFIEAQGKLRARSTVVKYDSLWRIHIGPVFADKIIGNVTVADLEDFFIKLGQTQAEHKHGKLQVYSKGHIDSVRKLLNNIFHRALNSGYIVDNPLSKISKDMYNRLGVAPENGRYLEANEVALLQERFAKSPLLCAFKIGYHTGMRISEVFGLLDTDLDFEKKIINVRRQLLYVKPLWVLAPLKTPAAYREIIMTDELYIYLRTWLEVKRANREKFGDAYIDKYKIGMMKPDNSVEVCDVKLPFLNVKETGALLTPGSATYMCKVARKELGMSDFSFHDLRHTHLTDMANRAYPPIELKRRAGHEKLTTTFTTYYHNNEYSEEQALRVLSTVKIRDYAEVCEEIATQEHLAAEWELYNETQSAESRVSSSELLGGDFTPNGFTPLDRLPKRYGGKTR